MLCAKPTAEGQQSRFGGHEGQGSDGFRPCDRRPNLCCNLKLSKYSVARIAHWSTTPQPTEEGPRHPDCRNSESEFLKFSARVGVAVEVHAYGSVRSFGGRTRVVSRNSMRASVCTRMYFGPPPERASVGGRPKPVGPGLRTQNKTTCVANVSRRDDQS